MAKQVNRFSVSAWFHDDVITWRKNDNR